jgi:hypothetical protein
MEVTYLALKFIRAPSFSAISLPPIQQIPRGRSTVVANLGVLKMADLPNRNTHTLQIIAAKKHSIPHFDIKFRLRYMKYLAASSV